MSDFFNKRSFKYFIAFLIPFLILIAMISRPLLTTYLGSELIIKTKPVDPRDLFRGDYVSLSYEINDIDFTLLDSNLQSRLDPNDYTSFDFLNQEKIYVILEAYENYYRVHSASIDKPNQKLYLIAKYQYPIWGNETPSKYNGISVRYNLDKYFVPENTGQSLEEKSREGALFAKIKIYKGYSLLVDIIE